MPVTRYRFTVKATPAGKATVLHAYGDSREAAEQVITDSLGPLIIVRAEALAV